MPKVSVIVPVYKAEAFIEACARSLFGQTLEDMEYIFVDDCSPDRSIEILKAVLRDYPNREDQVRIKSLEKNAGVAKAREIGLSAITGEYFIYCDSDDYVDLDAYEKMYLTAVREQSDVVVCDVDWSYPEKNEIAVGVLRNNVSDFISDLIDYKVPIFLSNKLFSTNLIGDVTFSSYGFGEDFVMGVQLIYHAKKLSYIAKPYYHYRQNGDSITHDNSVESRIHKFMAMRHNLSILKRFFQREKCDCYVDSIRRCAYYSKTNLLYNKVSSSCSAWCQWVVSFPGLTFHLKGLSIPVKERLFFYMAYIGFTPYSRLYKFLFAKKNAKN